MGCPKKDCENFDETKKEKCKLERTYCPRITPLEANKEPVANVLLQRPCYVAKPRRQQHTTSYCADDLGCAHDTVRNGYVRCEVSIGECAYQTLDKSKAKKAT